MGLKNLYRDVYEHFIKTRDTQKGFDFHEGKLKSVSPKSVSFTDRVRWWTVDRPQRLQRIKQERDRQQREILALKDQTNPSSSPPSLRDPSKPFEHQGNLRGPSGQAS